MNKANLKSYAPQARLDFIAAVTARANLLGITSKGVSPVDVRGDVAIIEGREWPAKIAGQRDKLIVRITRHGFEQSMEEIAYTWFNRFAALRYMELHDYLDHGWRVLSSRDGGLPEILGHASEISLSGLSQERARELHLAGNQDNELYKLLLVAQCNELSRSMPFMFERVDDDSELLLPENLLRTDSVLAKLVNSVPEEDWSQIEVIGWLYQFYISAKKDLVIGSVVKSEDIPAATQLFTPNWIVKYLVQNSVGRLWTMANRDSTLASQWEYFVKPAEQSHEVLSQLDALTQTRVSEDGGRVNPESIVVLDPACGSGHILVEAYGLLRAIYLERGFQPRAIPRLILEKNLFGIDIDDRAAQLASFALLMRARADDRRLLDDPPRLNVLSLQESKGIDFDEAIAHLGDIQGNRASLKLLLDEFFQAKTFGSLIQISPELKSALPALVKSIDRALQSGDLYAQALARDLQPLIAQAHVLAMRFDAVIANPPYMGSKGMNVSLKDYAKATYPDSKSDLFAMFIERGFLWCKPTGFNSMVTMQSWMFLSSYESLRAKLLGNHSLNCMVHMGNGVMGIAFGTAATVFLNSHVGRYEGSFSSCNNEDVNDSGSPIEFPVQNDRLGTAKADDFKKITGSPIAYWVSESILNAFADSTPLIQVLQTRLGLSTANNDEFLRYWHEVGFQAIGFEMTSIGHAIESRKKWFPYQKGGAFRKWFGNCDYVVNWQDDGREIKANIDEAGRVRSHNYNGEYSFREGVTWSDVTSGCNAFRYMPKGFLFDGRGSAGFASDRNDLLVSLGLLNSKVSFECIAAINPTIAINVGEIGRIPYHSSISKISSEVAGLVAEAISIARDDWNSTEQSWDFAMNPFLFHRGERLSDAFDSLVKSSKARVARMLHVENELNRMFVDAYRVGDTISTNVLESDITLLEENREKDAKRLVSYAIGCMMGRYSLNEPGLVYAGQGNKDFHADRYATFPADADGILPVTDEMWFVDAAASRMREFLLAIWGSGSLEENMCWLAESLGIKTGETVDESIRRYIADKFFKDHLQIYKKRPIYWLFSSGKQGAFQALVYLHRYNEGTLSRMRSEYVLPLSAKFMGRLEMLGEDFAKEAAAAGRTKIQKQIEALRKKQSELLAFDEKLRHFADKRISIDLDDGVKANYAKFGDLVAESKAITGGSDE
jgi:hypothetical protein